MAKRGCKPKLLGVRCPNTRCRKRPSQVVANGRYQTPDGLVRQFLCRTCGQGFTERQETLFYDPRTPHATVVLALKLLVKGMPLRGTAEIGRALRRRSTTSTLRPVLYHLNVRTLLIHHPDAA